MSSVDSSDGESQYKKKSKKKTSKDRHHDNDGERRKKSPKAIENRRGRSQEEEPEVYNQRVKEEPSDRAYEGRSKRTEHQRQDRDRDEHSFDAKRVKREPVDDSYRDRRESDRPGNQRHHDDRRDRDGHRARERDNYERDSRVGNDHSHRRWGGRDDRGEGRERREDSNDRSHDRENSNNRRGRGAFGHNRGGRGGRGGSNTHARVKQEPDDQFAFGGSSNSDDKSEKKEKDKPDFKLSGKLTEDTNTFRGVVIKYNEPPEARVPKRKWRLYPFKGEESLAVMHIHRQSAFLLGRDRKVADIPIDHPSCSKQHAVLQYRMVEYRRPDGSKGRRVRPYIIDLGSGNGTFVNNNRIEPQRYVELLERDVIKFGYSSREYVLLHDNIDTAEIDEITEDPTEEPT